MSRLTLAPALVLLATGCFQPTGPTSPTDASAPLGDASVCPLPCGGTCCPDGASCTSDGRCCTPSCDGLQCGPDGCGGSCGACQTHELCLDGRCGPCRGDTDCLGTPRTPRCHATLGRCVACDRDEQCGPLQDCDPTAFTCRPLCSSDADCETGRCHPGLGLCVECLSSFDCPAWRPACDETSTCLVCGSDADCAAGERCKDREACVGCLGDADCSGPTPRCHPGRLACVQCTRDEQCPAGLRCDASDGSCVQCLGAADCARNPGKPFCDPERRSCVGCRDHYDCPKGYCDGARAVCVECRGDPDCTGFPDRQFCLSGEDVCVSCRDSADCPAPLRCSPARKCQECLGEGDCAPGLHCSSAGRCLECESQADCSDAGRPHCLPATATCVACFEQYHCPPSKPVCTTAHKCALAHDSCGPDAADLVFVNGVAVAGGDTRLAANDHQASCGGTLGRDVVFRFTTRVPRDVQISVTPRPGSQLVPVVSLRRTCLPEDEVSCTLGAGGSGASVSLLELPARTYYLFVDAESGEGEFDLTVTATPPPDPPANDRCPGSELAFTGNQAVATGTLRSAHDEAQSSCGGAAPDVVHRFTLTERAAVTLKLTPGDAGSQPVVHVRRACDATEPLVGCAQATAAGAPAQLHLTGLTIGTYYVWVDETAKTRTTYTLEVTKSPGVPNDTCATATPLGLGLTSGTLVGANADYGNESKTSPCSEFRYSATYADVVYSFTAPTTGSYRFTASTRSGASLLVWVAPVCGSEQCLAAELDSALLAATAGQTYAVVVDTRSTAVCDFTLLVEPVTAPPNDSCTTPTNLPVNTTVQATLTNAIPSPGASGQDVTFRFTPPTSGRYRAVIPEPAGKQLRLTATPTPCVTYTPGPYGSLTFDAGTDPVYLQVFGYSVGDFSIAVVPVPKPPNEDCQSPTPLVEGVSVSGDLAHATPSSSVQSWPSDTSDLVYSFTPASTGTFAVEVLSGAIGLCVSRTCGPTMQCLPSADNAFPGESGVPYTLVVWGKGPFSFRVVSVTPPVNDECAGALPLTLDTPVTGSHAGAVADSLSRCTASGPDLVYRFVPPVSGLFLASLSGVSARSPISVQSECNRSCVAWGEGLVGFTGTAGSPLYIIVGSYDAPQPFSLVVSEVQPPANDTCAGALPLTENVWVEDSVVGAQADYPLCFFGSPQYFPLPDLIYSFTAPRSGTYRVRTTGWRFMFGAARQCMDCSTSFGQFAYDGLTGMDPPELSFRSSAGESVYFSLTGPFGIRIEPMTPPVNDLCSGTVALTLDTPVTGSLEGAVPDHAFGCTASLHSAGTVFFEPSLPDVLYQFTPAETGTYVVTVTSVPTRRLALSVNTVCGDGASCLGGATTSYSKPEAGVQFDATAGTPYFFQVGGLVASGTFSLRVERF